MPVIFKKLQGRTRGLDIVDSPEGHVEHETFTCAHCNRVVTVPHRADPMELGGLCRLCMEMVCPACVALDRCDPFERKLERSEARDRLVRSVLG